MGGGFRARRSREVPLDTIEAAHVFDFYVGEWRATSQSGTTTSLKVERLLGGKALQITGPTYAGLINFDPDANEWNWTWVNRSGAHDHLVGGVEGDRLVLHQKSVRDKPGAIGRVTFHHVAEGSYDMEWELSSDDGATWKLEYGAHAVRQERAGTNDGALTTND
jgi:hypothetical protein